MPLDPAVKLLLDQMAQAGGPTLREAGVEQGRAMIQALAMMEGDAIDVAHVEALTLAGTIPARSYAAGAGGPRPIIIWYHGGGFVIGDLETADRTCRKLATHTGALAVAEPGAVVTVHVHLAAVCGFQQSGDVQQRRLAGARRPHQCHRLPRIKIGAGALEHVDLAVALAKHALQFAQLENRPDRGFLHGVHS